VIKSALISYPEVPGLLNFLRFGLASLLFLPWTPLPTADGNRGIWRAGTELGIWMFLGACVSCGVVWVMGGGE
jgi:drug/metabolite transporter (DMT)-like permease